MTRRFFAVAALAITAAMPALADDVSSEITNNSALTVVYFYTSPVSDPSWSDDFLGTEVLAPGDSGTVTIFDGTSNCEYDIKFVLEDEQEVVDQVNICELSSYTLENAG